MKQTENKASYLEIQYPVLKRLEYSDCEIINGYAQLYNRFSCEFCFASLYLWDDIYRYKLSFYNDWLIIFDTRDDFILMPLGKEVTALALAELSTLLRQGGFSGDISNVSPEFIESQPELTQSYVIENDRALAEYIYSTEKLVELRGKKLRKKKNHISQFLRKYPDYQVKSLDRAVRRDCLAMVEGIMAEKHTVSNSVREEVIVLEKAFKCFDSIPLDGIAIYINDHMQRQLVCFAVFSPLNRDVYTIHFEKVNYSYPGAAQIINWETAKVLKEKCRYVNREQDLGIPGLRQAKLSYEPEFIYPDNFLSFKGISATDIVDKADIQVLLCDEEV